MRPSPVIILLIMIFTGGCSQQSAEINSRFVTEVVDLAIRLKNNEPIELTTLYDSLTSILPADSAEQLILATELKQRGFKVIEWGRGNLPPNGVRIVTVKLQKDECECTVNKMYYSTAVDSLYEMHESISCLRPTTLPK